MNAEYKIALWQKPADNKKILCELCPRYCSIGEGQTGFCYIRKNIGGTLYNLGYGRPTGFAVDPIEKKPLYHFYPGSEILSFGTAGCNLGCKFCQNWTMSKARMDEINSIYASPDDVIALAKKYDTPSIAYTYNDPIIFAEYAMDISKLAREENINTVAVTNGYISRFARRDFFKNIDAANVDLKAFNEEFYRKLTYSGLKEVLDSLIWLKNETDVWLEITTLLIPGENDSSEELKSMCYWILTNLGESVPVHFSAFHPAFKLMDKPRASLSSLINARNIALSEGLKFVYTGNVYNPEGQTTFCPGCSHSLLVRDWNAVAANNLSNGACPNCGRRVAGRF